MPRSMLSRVPLSDVLDSGSNRFATLIVPSPSLPVILGTSDRGPLARLCGFDPADAQCEFVQLFVVSQLDRAKLSVGEAAEIGTRTHPSGGPMYLTGKIAGGRHWVISA